MVLIAFVFALLLPLATLAAEQDKDECIKANPGTVCGSSLTVLGKELVQFWGVPYARPPVGELRFKAPQPLESWKEPIAATKFGKSCIQDLGLKGLSKVLDDMQPDHQDTDEDCLFLNIIAPKHADSLPVMVFIHGGGYFFGTSFIPMYDAVGMVAEADVIYVSLNYRLGILGFGYLGTDNMPGNMGLFDQRLAMKWVHDNIAHFGGDPEKVTIFGESAGGASVSAHVAAPDSRKYFSSAIVQSGTLYSPWAMHKPGNAKAKVLELASYLDCDTTSESTVEKCLLAKPAQELTKDLGKRFLDFMAAPINPDGNFFGGDAFAQLTADPALKSLKILIGNTAEEAGLALPLSTNLLLRFHEERSWGLSDDQLETLTKSILHGYSSDAVGQILAKYRQLDLSNVDRLSRMISDDMFDCPTLQFVRELAKTNVDNVYFYKYDHAPGKNYHSAILGAYHTSEIPIHMGRPLVEEGWPEEDKVFSKEIIHAWTCLEKSGSPSVNNDWLPIGSGPSPNMKILSTKSQPMTAEHPDDRCKLLIDGRPSEKKFWKEEL